MIQYNTTDKEIVVPQGLGNLPITINQSGGDVDLSNYATTQYVDEEILKVNNEIETINERITDIENNGDFLVISPVELGLSKNNVFKSPYTIGEWKNILNSNKTIILRMPIQANSTDNVEDSEVNYCERYIIGSDIFTGIQLIFKWYTLHFLGDSDDNYIPNIKLYKTEPLRYDALIDDLDERVTTLDENVTSLDERVTTLENNSGSSNDNTLIIELSPTDEYSLRTDDAEQIINNFRTKKVIIKFVYSDDINTEIEVINVDYLGDYYKRIVGILNDTTYIWEFPMDSYSYEVKPKIVGEIKYEINWDEDNYSIYENDLESLIQTKKNNPNSRIVLYHRGFNSFITDVVTMDYFLNYDNEQNFYVYAIVGSKMLRWKYSKTYNSNPIEAEIKNLWE